MRHRIRMNAFGKSVRRIHFVGMKGIAMAALAVWCKEAGFVVSGTDVEEEFPSDEVLATAGISVSTGFDAARITDAHPQLVIYTGAHGGMDNPEVQTAIAQGIPVLPHGKALGMAMAGKRQISVAGCHGKTTTTAMIATMLKTAGHDPSYAVGCGQISGLGLPGHNGSGQWFVAEADEYVTDPTHDATPRFLWQKPEIAVVTNVDYDHPDVYGSLKDVQKAFAAFVRQQKGLRVTIVNADDPASQHIIRSSKGNTVITYGTSSQADYRISRVEFGRERTVFQLDRSGMAVTEFFLKIPGKHNVLNATAAAIGCFSLGLSWEVIGRGLAAFGGTKRRFEKIGTIRGVAVYDDYAHHPKEILATTTAARAWYPNSRLIVVFQPHTYSRTHALMNEFSFAFGEANIVLLTDIYASKRESDTLGITGKTLTMEVKKHHSNVLYTPAYEDVASYLRKIMRSGDVIIYMGAGDIYAWSRTFVKENQ